MKLYIIGPDKNGDGIYYLLTEEGDCLASHLCSNIGFARGDLEARRPERQEEWKKRFGTYEVLNIGDDDMTKERLIQLNEEIYQRNKKMEEEKK